MDGLVTLEGNDMYSCIYEYVNLWFDKRSDSFVHCVISSIVLNFPSFLYMMMNATTKMTSSLSRLDGNAERRIPR